VPRLTLIARDPLPIREAVQAWLPADVPLVRCQASELNLEQIFEHLNGGDLFGSAQAYWYQDFLSLKLGPKEGQRLAEMLARVPSTIYLACSQVLDFEQDWEEGKKLKTQIYANWTEGEKLTDLRQLSTPARAPGWLVQRAQERYGLKLSTAQTQRLLAVSDNRLVLADSELAKLSLLKTSDALQPVPDNLLHAVLSTNPAAEYTAMVEALLSGAADTVARLRVWHKATKETYKLVYELKRKLFTLREMASGKRLPSYLSGQVVGFAKHWRAPAIDTALLALARTEHELKSGHYTGLPSQDAELAALELLAVDLAHALRS
jgi:DNA polymerase III delta subunit